MRTRGAVEDLVVVDLDDPDDVASRGPAAQRRHFEDRYAELPFGLGTVPRRLDHQAWFTRPGVILWIFLALIGLLALTGLGEGDDRDTPSPPPSSPVVSQGSPLMVQTGVHLALYHVGSWIELDVDSKALRPLPRRSLPAYLADLQQRVDSLGVLPADPNRAVVDFQGRTVCLSLTDPLHARVTEPGPCAPTERPISTLGPSVASSRDGRFFFMASGSQVLVIDTLEGGFVRRVDARVPPFEAMYAIDQPGMQAPPSTQRT